MSDEIEWPREIWAEERGEHDMDGRHVFSEFATVPRFEGDGDREFHRYVDSDIYEIAARYWKERTDQQEAEIARLRAQLDASATTPEKAARALLNAGCSGAAQLTWEIDRALYGEPSYPPGDAPWSPPDGNKRLYDAVYAALSAMADGGRQ